MTSDEINYYDLLGVSRSASAEQIRRAYRDKMKIAHPDQLAGKLAEAQASGDAARFDSVRREIARAEDLTKQLNLAHDTLSDPAKRRRYDIELHMQRMHREPPPRPTSSAQSTYTPPPRPRRNYNWWAFVALMALVTVIRFVAIGFNAASNTRPRSDSPHVIATIMPPSDSEEPGGFEWSGRVIVLSESGNLEIDLDSISLDAESHYERGLDYLAQSGEVNDSFERLAMDSFNIAIVVDSEFAPAFRMAGLIHYDRWLASDDEAERRGALLILSEYDRLTDGEPDAEVRAMLDVLD